MKRTEKLLVLSSMLVGAFSLSSVIYYLVRNSDDIDVRIITPAVLGLLLLVPPAVFLIVKRKGKGS